MLRDRLPALAGLCSLASLACGSGGRPSPPAPALFALASGSAAPSLPPAPVLPASPAAGAPAEPGPLDGDAPYLALHVEGFGDAVVSLPLGARGKRPTVIATHGNFDRPEWQCEVWREIVRDRAFVLCPRGVARPDSPSRDDIRFTYATNQALERELEAALVALQRRFPDQLDAQQPLYAGFSLGAIMGVSLATRAPARYSRLVLTEGGHDRWTSEAAVAFARGGGRRVLFVCSQAWCESDARRAAVRLEKAGVATRVARGPDVGHRYDGPTAEATKRVLPWALEEDPRWFVEPPSPP